MVPELTIARVFLVAPIVLGVPVVPVHGPDIPSGSDGVNSSGPPVGQLDFKRVETNSSSSEGVAGSHQSPSGHF